MTKNLKETPHKRRYIGGQQVHLRYMPLVIREMQIKGTMKWLDPLRQLQLKWITKFYQRFRATGTFMD